MPILPWWYYTATTTATHPTVFSWPQQATTSTATNPVWWVGQPIQSPDQLGLGAHQYYTNVAALQAAMMQQQLQQQMGLQMGLGLLGQAQQLPRQAPQRQASVAAIIRDHDQRQEGRKRARELLLSFLSEAQRAELSKDNAVTVLGRHARYRITYGRIANIEVYRGEALAHRLCVHPENDDLPVEDVMLSQLLHLRADEDRLLLTANVHR